MSDISDASLSDAQEEAEQVPQPGDAGDRFGRTSRLRIGAFYGGATLVAVILLNVILRAGADLEAPQPTGGAATEEEAIHVGEIFWKLLLASAVIIVAARMLGALFRRFGQPQVMGEIVAGILLGPSLLGAVWPGAQDFLFGGDVLPLVEVLAELGLIFFMFLIGLELDVRLIKGRGQAAAAVSHASIIVPFILGVLAAFLVFSELGSEEGEFVPFALFMGASMSITAFPVLARILTERGLNKTRLGAVTITCAAIDDVTAWCLLAVVIAIAAAGGLGGAFVTIGLAIAFIAAMIVLVRPLVARIATRCEEDGTLSPTVLAMVFAGLLLSALATDRIGIHAIFGAFLFGAIMPQQSNMIHELTQKLEDVAVLFLLPLFFAYSGLRTEIGQLGTDPELWAYCALIVGIAIAGKWGGSAVAGRFVGLSWRESSALGILMNCRGLTELVILNIGLDLGVIPPALFAMLVIMALVTTFMTTPILAAIYPREEQEKMIAEEGGATADDGTWRILVHIPTLDNAHQLVANALALSRHVDQDVQVVLLRTLQVGDYGFRSGGARQAARVDRAAGSLRPLVDFVEGAGFEAVPLVVQTSDPAETISRVAGERNPDLVLLSVTKPVFGGRLSTGLVGKVLRDAPADAAVLVDPAGRGANLRKGAQVLVPYGGGFHEDVGLDLALRLARSSAGQVRLLGAAADGQPHELAETAAGAYEREGVWTTSHIVDGDIVREVLDAARDADLVVLGVSDTWADEPDSVGHLREVVAGATATPLLVVRRHGQQRRRGPRRWFGRRGEWMEDVTGEIDLREPEAAQQ